MMILLLLFPLLFALSAANCPNGYHQYQNKCYALVQVEASWAEAVVYCEAVDAQLVQVDSEAENNYLINWLKSQTSTIISDGVWMGGQDLIVEGEYKWLYSDDLIEKQYWAPGDPNNDHEQDCMLFWKHGDYKWDDGYCKDPKYFMCQRSAGEFTNPVA